MIWRILALAILIVSLVPWREANAAQPIIVDEESSTTLPEPAPTQSPASDQPPLLFSEDFEAYGDSSRWHRDHQFPVQRDVVADGTWAARLTSNGTSPVYGYRRLETSEQHLFVRMRFNMLDIGTGPVTILHLRASDMSSVIRVQVSTDGRISYITGATGHTSVSQPVAPLESWHELVVGLDTTSTDRSVRIWVDQTRLTTLSESAWLNDAKIGVIEIGDNSSGRSMDLAIDNVLVDDAFIPADREADPVPGTLRVRTIPSSPNIEFELDGEIFVTNRDGIARIQVRRWSTDLRNRIIVHDRAMGSSGRLTFTGWREWMSPRTRDVYAAFALWKPVSFAFVDTYGQHVDPADVDSVTVKNSIGDILTLRGTDLAEVNLFVSSVVTTPEGLNIMPVTWYVDEVMIDGSNVVNRSQQRTTLENTTIWSIELLFFGVHFQAADAFFGTPLGTHVVVEAVDGSQYRLPLNESGSVAMPRLARGEYLISVEGGGYSPPRPIRVSRDQTVQLEVVSSLDLMLLVGTASMVGIGLIVAGRPFLVTAPIRFLADRVPRRLHSRAEGSRA